MSRPGATRCRRCQVVTPYDEMRRTVNRRGRTVWVCRPCLLVWRSLRIKVA